MALLCRIHSGLASTAPFNGATGASWTETSPVTKTHRIARY
jgi:hypothetical protein